MTRFDDTPEENENGLAFIMVLLTFLTFFILQYVIVSPFGKHAPSANAKKSLKSIIFQPRMNARLGWILFETPNLFWVVVSLKNHDSELIGNWPYTRTEFKSNGRGMINANSILLFLFASHYVNRSIIYPLKKSNKSQPIPLIVVLAGFAFTNFNGYLQTKSLCKDYLYPDSYHIKPQFILSVILFLIGARMNVNSDAILRDLRNQNKGYQIPRGSLFEYVSSANLFGEIIEWFGFAAATGFSYSAVAFFVYTLGNLIPRALATHEWYLNKFEDYPKNRKALIPLIL